MKQEEKEEEQQGQVEEHELYKEQEGQQTLEEGQEQEEEEGDKQCQADRTKPGRKRSAVANRTGTTRGK